jgi:hypothetical protein
MFCRQKHGYSMGSSSIEKEIGWLGEYGWTKKHIDFSEAGVLIRKSMISGMMVRSRKLKKIDEQIILLNNLKSQCLTKLQSLPRITVPQTTSSVNSQSLEDKIVLFKSYFRGRDDV